MVNQQNMLLALSHPTTFYLYSSEVAFITPLWRGGGGASHKGLADIIDLETVDAGTPTRDTVLWF